MCMYIYIYIYVYMCIYIYIYTYTHIHIVYTSRCVRVILPQGPCYFLCSVPILTDD